MSGAIENPLHQMQSEQPQQPADRKLLEVETEVSHPKVSFLCQRPATHFSTRPLASQSLLSLASRPGAALSS